MPRCIIQAVKNLQDCAVEISYRHDWPLSRLAYDSVQSTQSISSLLPITRQLSSLSVIIPLNSRQLLSKLAGLVVRCRALKSLRIHGATTMDTWNQARPFASIRDCQWLMKESSHDLVFPAITQLELTSFCVCECHDWTDWENFVAWNSIKKLQLSCPSFFIRLAPKLLGLNELALEVDSKSQIDCNPYAASISTYINSALLRCPPLKTLELCNCTDAVDEHLLQKIGPSLRKLTLQDDPVRRAGQPLLSIEALMAISRHAPLLQEFRLDATRHVKFVCSTPKRSLKNFLHSSFSWLSHSISFIKF